MLLKTTPSWSRQLRELVDASSTLPSAASNVGAVELGLSELKNRIRRARGSRSNNDPHYTRAHYLLAGSGVAIEDIERELKAIAPPAPSSAPLHKDESVLAAIDRLLATALRDFDAFVSLNVAMDWRKRRNEIYSSFGLAPRKCAAPKADWGQHSVGHSVLGPRVRGGEFTDLPADLRLVDFSAPRSRARFEAYANAVYALNSARAAQKTAAELCSVGTDSRARQLAACWEIVAGLVPVDSREYEEFAGPGGMRLRRRVAENGVKVLEKQFMQHVDAVYSQNPENGLPTRLNKVRQYVSTHLKRLFGGEVEKSVLIVNGSPIWAEIFYLVRAGCASEAQQLVKENEAVFRKIDSGFAAHLAAYVAGPSAAARSAARAEFNASLKNTEGADPYRYALYKLMGRCDLGTKLLPRIVATTEDWIWANLLLVEESGDNSYTLLDFQQNVLKYGPDHFNTKANDLTYVRVLLLVGLFEEAVRAAFLIGEPEAVHLAVALAQCGLLRVRAYADVALAANGSTNNLCTRTPKGTEINFARLLGFYTRSFRVSDTIVALEYLLLINLAGGERYRRLAVEAVRELVVEARDFKLLLGTLGRDGARYPGRIEARLGLLYGGTPSEARKAFLLDIVEPAAKRIGEEGRTQDCLLLYQLAENHEQVVAIVNRLLGDALGGSDVFLPTVVSEPNPVEIGRKLLEAYKLNPAQVRISAAAVEVLEKLLAVAAIKELFIAKKYAPTLAKIRELGLVPVGPGHDLPAIRARCQEINQQQIDYNLMKTIGALLLMLMHCINSLIGSYGQSLFFNEILQSNVEELKQTARQIMMFAGMIRYRMSREVYVQLTELEMVYN